MRNFMGYVYAISNYLRTDKGRYDLMDTIRAIIIIGAVMAMVRVLWDMILVSSVFTWFTR